MTASPWCTRLVAVRFAAGGDDSMLMLMSLLRRALDADPRRGPASEPYAMPMNQRRDAARVAGFVDHHAHLLKTAAGVPYPWEGTTVREFHERVWRTGSTPMDVPEPASTDSPDELAARLRDGLATAAAVGLVEVTEMGMRDWCYLDALTSLSERGPLPARVRLYLASGLAEQAGVAELAARRADGGPWVRLDGIKFYADGWLVPRTCAVCRDFDDV